MYSNYNELLIRISPTNRSMHIENLERNFKVVTKITPAHIKGGIIFSASLGGMAKFVDCTVISLNYYMGYWMKVTVNHQEWSNEEAYEERYKKCTHFRDHYNGDQHR